MDFEIAVFRVYEQTLEGLIDENDGRNRCSYCKFFEYMFLIVGIFLTLCLIFLHLSFVGSPGCLPQLLAPYVAVNASSFILAPDQILAIDLEPKFSYHNSVGKKDFLDSVISDNNHSRRLQQTNRLHNIFTSKIAETHNLRKRNHSDSTASNFTEILYDYQFAYEYALLGLSQKMRSSHNFRTINVTMAGEACFGSSLTQFLLPLGGTDTVVMNNIMYTVGSSGIMISALDDYYTWSNSDITPFHGVIEWVSMKIQIVFTSLLAFFFLSTITALLIRVLISSGVVLIFPILWVFLCKFTLLLLI
jgi:hypothetical protein